MSEVSNIYNIYNGPEYRKGYPADGAAGYPEGSRGGGLTLRPVWSLHGVVTVPGDKSISHRAVMFGSLASGTTRVKNFLSSTDCLSTMDCFARMGVAIMQDPSAADELIIHGAGLYGLQPAAELYSGNSGTTTRILSGILAPQRFTSILSGDESVNRRPMKRIIDPLTRMGADIRSVNNDGCAPLKITGSPLHGITFRTEVASAQVKSAILCAGLYADTDTCVVEPAVSRDHTERMLTAFGHTPLVDDVVDADGSFTGHRVRIAPAAELISPGVIVVPGDISSAAYYIAAASITPSSEVLIRGVGINETRAGILRAAEAMGADITILNRVDAAEPYADLLVRSSSLHGTEIGGSLIPALIDELPVIAVMAAAAEGTTTIRDAAELRVKESDRIAAMTEGLQAMGARIIPSADGMTIEGGHPLHGARIRTFRDHRVAMSFAVASLTAQGETVLDDPDCVRISYPGFFSDLASLVK